MQLYLLYFISILTVAAQLQSGDVSAHLPEQTISVFNGILKNSLIPIANSKLGQVIRNANLDPFEGFKGNTTTPEVDAKICKLSANVEYNIQNVTGLSLIQINSLTLIDAIDSTNGSLMLNLGGSSNNLTVNSNIDGTIILNCNVPLSPIRFNGNSTIKDILVKVEKAQAIASLATEQVSVTNIELMSLSSDFGAVQVNINQLSDPFGQILLHDIISIVAAKFKQDIIDLINDQVRNQVNQVLQSQLPLEAPSAIPFDQ